MNDIIELTDNQEELTIKDLKNLKIVASIYARVSTEDQAKYGKSVEAQIKILKDWCEKERITIWKIYDRDRGKSGKNTKRKDFQQMLKDAEDKKFNLLLILNLSRFARRYIITTTLIPLLNRKGIVVHNFDGITDAEGKKLMAFIDELQISTTRKATKKTMEHMASKGDKLMSRPPFGYYVEKIIIDGEERKILKEDTLKIEKIKKIFRHIDNQYLAFGLPINYSKIARRFNLSRDIIRTMLQNRYYIGEIKWDERWRKGTHKSIINKKLFERIQKKIQS